MPGHAQQRLIRKMEPEAPLPPQPPELTARYNKKVLTLEEIVQAHGNSVHAQKYSIEVVGGKIKAVCNDCKVALSCGNLSDAKRHQCNKRPRSGQDATDADGASNDMPFERITACWNPAQRLPANIMTEFWRRIHMWFIDAEIPFAKVDNPWLRDAFTLVGIGMMSERSLLTSQLLLRYQEVQRKVAKQVAELEVTNTVAMGVSDGYKNKYAQLGASLMDFSSLLPDGGRIFHDVKDVSDLKKDAVGIKDLLQRWPDELRSAGHPVPVIKGWIMDNTSTNKRALQLMEDDDPDTINMGCAGMLPSHQMPKPPDAAGRVAVEPISMRRAFWGKAGPRGFPHLAVAASRLLGVHATSAASERNWSAWGRLFTSARTRLTLERAKMLIYIKANAGLGARHNTEAQLLARMGE
ncbi:hypothetical protein QJQ45_028165 [Haematococcus lacustris]|nr:hypothetical protein QJQ45_028165 [Haematococcus lacustris]